MTKKINIAVVFGGASPEHNVSIESGRTIVSNIDVRKYKIFCVYVARSGTWFSVDFKKFTAKGVILKTAEILPYPGKQCFMARETKSKNLKPLKIDVVFPIIHGTTGEDGVLQGLLEMMDIPYVGSGVFSSSIGMDKIMSKSIAQREGLPCLEHRVFEKNNLKLNFLKLGMKLPLFVKPTSLGSSVGISKVKKYSSLKKAVNFAFKHEDKIMVEMGIEGAREIVCGVLSNGKKIEASSCGEVKLLNHEFYDYDAKYLDDDGFNLIVPAGILKKNSDKMRAMAIKIFRALGCGGFARVDFLMDPADENKFYFCEINTIPGFTSHSLYPCLWEYSGLKIEELIDRLIRIALKKKRV